MNDIRCLSCLNHARVTHTELIANDLVLVGVIQPRTRVLALIYHIIVGVLDYVKRIKGIGSVFKDVGLKVSMDPDRTGLVELLISDVCFTNNAVCSKRPHVLAL